MDVSLRGWLVTGVILAVVAGVIWWSTRPAGPEILRYEGKVEIDLAGHHFLLPSLDGASTETVGYADGFEVTWDLGDKVRTLEIRTTHVVAYPDVIAKTDLDNGGVLWHVTNVHSGDALPIGTLDGTLRAGPKRYRIHCSDRAEVPNPVWCVQLLSAASIDWP